MMKKNEHKGMFCQIYGDSLRNRFLECLLQMGNLDFAVGDIAKEIKISRPKAYQIMNNFEKQGIIIKSRIISGSQLYELNNKSSQVKILKQSFKECLKLVVEEKDSQRSTFEQIRTKKEIEG
jgi:DNA-binding MarR family transcriptional regulator